MRSTPGPAARADLAVAQHAERVSMGFRHPRFRGSGAVDHVVACAPEPPVGFFYRNPNAFAKAMSVIVRHRIDETRVLTARDRLRRSGGWLQSMVYFRASPYHWLASETGLTSNPRPPHQSRAPDVDVIPSTSRSRATHPARAKGASNDVPDITCLLALSLPAASIA